MTYIKETELVINRFPKQKAPHADGFSGEFYQTFKEKIIINLLQSPSEERSSENVPNPSYEASIALILKRDKGIKRKKNYRPVISHVHRCKNPQQSIANIIQQCMKRIIHLTSRIYPRYASVV